MKISNPVLSAKRIGMSWAVPCSPLSPRVNSFDSVLPLKHNQGMNAMPPKPQQELKDWLTIPAAAERVGVSDGYVRQLVRAKKVLSLQLGERHILVEKRSVDDFFSRPKETGRPRSGIPKVGKKKASKPKEGL